MDWIANKMDYLTEALACARMLEPDSTKGGYCESDLPGFTLILASPMSGVGFSRSFTARKKLHPEMKTSSLPLRQRDGAGVNGVFAE